MGGRGILEDMSTEAECGDHGKFPNVYVDELRYGQLEGYGDVKQ